LQLYRCKFLLNKRRKFNVRKFAEKVRRTTVVLEKTKGLGINN
jgi:hypothetical protein